jgi:hypothetical protein
VECIDQVAPFWFQGCPFYITGHIQCLLMGLLIVSSSLPLSFLVSFGPFGANDDPSWVLCDVGKICVGSDDCRRC